jgi:DNA polymerase-3 subunit gamma/tau
MSDYIVTARKWRPMKFEDVVGQSHVTTTLRNAIATNRLAHAYLFSGQRGCGKTTTARILAKAVNCVSPKDNNPDNECDNCKEITEGRSFDVLEIDGASNRGVEEIRNLRESVRYSPAKGKYKVYIIDEVHMLTKEAFNALLKTLEEPPSHVLFIFATTEIHKLPATITSRCQRFDFRRIAIHEIMANLKWIAKEEGLQIDDDALMLIAKRGDGSLRDSQSIFDQVVSLCGTTITHVQILQALNIVDQEVYFRVTDLIKARDAKGGLTLVEELMSGGHDIKEFLNGVSEHFRNILIVKTTGSTELIEASDVYRKRYAEEAAHFSIADLLRLQRLVNGTESAIRWSAQPRFKLEADMIQMITLPSAAEVGDLIQRVDELSKGLLSEKKKLISVPSATQIPIVSSVPASALTGSSDKGVTTTQRPSFSKPSFIRPTLVQPATPTSSLPQGSTLTEGEVTARWQEFILEVRRQKIALGSVMDSAMPLGVRAGAIRIGCANDFQASSIKRNRELLNEIVQKVFNTRAYVEAEVTPLTQQHPQPQSGTPQPSSSGDEHPIIKAMIRELGAEPLQ